MHDLDVELQAIRRKLAALKAQPPPGQAQAIPLAGLVVGSQLIRSLTRF